MNVVCEQVQVFLADNPTYYSLSFGRISIVNSSFLGTMKCLVYVGILAVEGLYCTSCLYKFCFILTYQRVESLGFFICLLDYNYLQKIRIWVQFLWLTGY